MTDLWVQRRTRASLLASLVEEAQRKSHEFLGFSASTSSESATSGISLAGPGSRFIETVRKALSSAKNASSSNNNHKSLDQDVVGNGTMYTDPASVLVDSLRFLQNRNNTSHIPSSPSVHRKSEISPKLQVNIWCQCDS